MRVDAGRIDRRSSRTTIAPVENKWREVLVDYREKAFKEKFADAAAQLGVSSEQIVSLKVRENVGAYHEYQELLGVLGREARIDHAPVPGNFQGKGHLVGDTKTKIIIVEHETGLEILYVAGSIASIVGLVPLVLQCWRAVRGHLRGSRHHDFPATVETRRLDSGGHLVEERNHGMGLPWSDSFDIVNRALLSAAEDIDGEMQHLKSAVADLVERVDAIEKRCAKKKPRKAAKTRTKKAKKKSKA